MRRLKILTWPTQRRYLRSLARTPHDFLLLQARGEAPDPLPAPNLRWVPAAGVRRQRFDCILFQDEAHYRDEQFDFLSAAQRRLPKIYLEHEPPREHPVDSRHLVSDAEVLVVHVTPFNRLMWDNGRSPTRVIEHGVAAPPAACNGGLARGLVAVDASGLERGRRQLGLDLLQEARTQVPLDLAGNGARFAARHRFLFHPVRYASLGLAAIEAMMTGLPVVALATAEMASLIRDGANGYLDTDAGRLVRRMKELLADKELALALGREARRTATERFDIGRFVADWNRALAEAA